MKVMVYEGKNGKVKGWRRLKLCLALAMCLGSLSFAGCGNVESVESAESVEKNEAAVSTESSSGTDEKAVADSSTQADSNSLTDTTEGVGPVPLYPGTHRSSLFQEDENYIYLCGSCHISKVDKATGEQQVLWENRAEVQKKKAGLYASGSGLLLGDKIYFIERWSENNWSEERAFSCVNTDGSGYERLAELAGGSDSLYLLNGMLYVDDFEQRLAYQVFEDGCLSAPDEYEEGFKPDNQLYYVQEGNHILFEAESMEEFGALLTMKDFSSVMLQKNMDDNLTYAHELNGLVSFNSSYFLCKSFEEEGVCLKLVERKQIAEKYVEGKDITIEPKQIYMLENNTFQVLGMDEEYAYVLELLDEDTNGVAAVYSYDSIKLETGEHHVIFRQENIYGRSMATSLMFPFVKDGYLYYVDETDYRYYLMRRKADGSGEAENVTTDCIYDTGIAHIGTLQSYSKDIYSKKKPEIILYNVDLQWLAVDDRYPGANLINTYLNAHQETNIAICEQDAQSMEDWAEEVGNTMCSQLSSGCYELGYYDNHYISFLQEEYVYYSGAAHGLPYWVSFTFDLETGEKLLLSDICTNSEEEIKEIVARYFKELIDKAPEDFWPDAVEAVRETITLESDFCLTEEGIVFYYEPYALAAYAAGFQQVTIPYEEFDMSIILEKAANWK